MQGDKAAIHDFFHLGIGLRQDEIADTDIVEQFVAFIDHVDHIDRFAAFGVLADGIEHFGHGILFVHIHEIGRHQPAHAVLGITQQFQGNLPFIGVEGFDEVTHDAGWQFFEEGHPVIRRQLIQQLGGLQRGQSLDEPLLRGRFEDLENAGGPVDGKMRDDLAFVFFVVVDKGGHVADVLVIQEILYRQFVLRSDHFFEPLLQ